MFLFSAGLVTILTFIVTYLESHTIDLNKKENYYLGYNLKKQNMYNNFWLKSFNEVPIKLFLWVLASFPVIKMAVKYKYYIEILEIIKSFLNDNTYVYSIWLSVVIVTCFYCTAILIESVCLSRISFVRSSLYDS